MIEHFGIKFRDSKYGFNISRENYAIINNKSSFQSGKIYSDEYCQRHQKNCLINYDLNMNRFSLLDKEKFNNELNKLVKKYEFDEITNLNDCDNLPGYYIMVLDNYCQAYIGTSQNIKKRIIGHWTKTKEFDRLIFGGVEGSILSIDSFRVLDTTRIYVLNSDEIFLFENQILEDFPVDFLLNRTAGGKLELGLLEAIEKRRIIKDKN